MNTFFTGGPPWARERLWGPVARQKAAQLGFDVRVNPATGDLSTEDWARALEGVEALITTWGAPRLTADVLARNTTLRIVGHAAGSVAGLVSPALHERGIPVVTANPVMARTVAEWCLMITQLTWHRFPDYAGGGRCGPLHWDRRDLVRGIHEATIAIWGYGTIGERLVRLLHPLEPREILVHSSHLAPEEAAAAGVALVDFDELFARGDVIHLLAGLTRGNLGRVGAAQLRAIRDGAVLVNAGRAELVDHDALLAELRRDRFTAAFDVHHEEPLPLDSPFNALPNVILTPHCAFRGEEPLYVPHVLEEFDRFRRGEPLRSRVSSERAARMTHENLRKA